MSAFIVSDAHIDLLVTYATGGGPTRVSSMNPRELGQILVNENYDSVNHRYRNDHNDPHTYEYKPYTRPMTPIQVIKACDCYDYQACETDDYEQSVAAKLIRQIRAKAISNLPGWDEALWGIPSDHRSNAVSLSSLS